MRGNPRISVLPPFAGIVLSFPFCSVALGFFDTDEIVGEIQIGVGGGDAGVVGSSTTVADLAGTPLSTVAEIVGEIQRGESQRGSA